MTRKYVGVWMILLGVAMLPAWAWGWTSENDAHSWAQPVEVDEPHNLFKIDDGLYRGGHLSRAGADELRCLGVQTVVSFRVVGWDERPIRCAGLNYIQIPFEVWRPCDDQVVEFLRIAMDPARWPVYFYCNRGAERTGMMAAAYRVVVQNWSKEEAICEMVEGPFDYHAIYRRVVQYIRDMDVERIRQRLGLTVEVASPDARGEPRR